MTDAFARTYGVELLCQSAPNLDKATLLSQVRRFLPDAQWLDSDPASKLFSFLHPRHQVQLADAVVPAQTLLAVADKPLEAKNFEPALQQTWEFPEARERVTHARSAVLVTDMMSAALPYRERLELFQACLRGVLECVPCTAIHWRPSGRIVDPEVWKAAFDANDPAQCFFAGAVNVRLFNVGDASASTGEIVMDTLGLAALGVVDLQCHFHGLDAGRVASVLYNTSFYLFKEGDVIQDGHTVEGAARGSKWKCQHEASLAAPKRGVLDLNPGPMHAAGRSSN